MIATYNKNVGDVLMLIVANNEGAEVTYERKADVARIFREDTGQTVGWNIFDIKKTGQIWLKDRMIYLSIK